LFLVNEAELKSVIAKETGLKPEEQKLLFRGKEMADHEHLHMVGVKNNAKIILIENLSTKNEDLENVAGLDAVVGAGVQRTLKL
nr:molecular chaperone regulator BAG-1, ubiquitin-related domain protein [Tanacetum cinerariifolium]